MRTLNQQELKQVAGAGTTATSPIDAIKAALAAKGITISIDKAAGTVTVTTPKGSKTFTLPTPPAHTGTGSTQG